jgi:chemosensory pili system protein ChpA (sensor histidine kinase/response regulator)
MATGRILVVEDDDDIRDTLRDLLMTEGYEVDVAKDGTDAIDRLEGGQHATLILLDMMMPGMDGESFLAAIRRRPELAGVHVVVISGNAKARDRAQALAAEDCLVKPFELDALLGMVHRYV